MNNFLELENIRKSFTTEKKINVIRGLSRKFKLGKIYAIMGPSGSGKSTLLNQMMAYQLVILNLTKLIFQSQRVPL